jgi:hypothetical protein
MEIHREINRKNDKNKGEHRYYRSSADFIGIQLVHAENHTETKENADFIGFEIGYRKTHR